MLPATVKHFGFEPKVRCCLTPASDNSNAPSAVKIRKALEFYFWGLLIRDALPSSRFPEGEMQADLAFSIEHRATRVLP